MQCAHVLLIVGDIVFVYFKLMERVMVEWKEDTVRYSARRVVKGSDVTTAANET